MFPLHHEGRDNTAQNKEENWQDKHQFKALVIDEMNKELDEVTGLHIRKYSPTSEESIDITEPSTEGK